MSKFTPGPWILEARRNCVDEFDTYLMPIGLFMPEGLSEEDCRLLESAPAMFAALLRAERKLEAYIGVCNGDKELTDAVLPMIREALAKAEGKS